MYEDRRMLIEEFLKQKSIYPTPMDIEDFHVRHTIETIPFFIELKIFRLSFAEEASGFVPEQNIFERENTRGSSATQRTARET